VELASILLEHLSKTYPENIKKRYKLESLQDKKGYELLEEAGKKRGCIISGGEVDLTRIAAIVLDEFRGGKNRKDYPGKTGRCCTGISSRLT